MTFEEEIKFTKEIKELNILVEAKKLLTGITKQGVKETIEAILTSQDDDDIDLMMVLLNPEKDKEPRHRGDLWNEETYNFIIEEWANRINAN